eukprot:TRINITY_DN21091_c0_g1_i1.p1 TRINITY_DN21091_c0_g1~~TRINITY_DN21091_c0_g1_i1.p1  ORF type:complete len:261 (+),score=46.92 TRINITY_DN21091_c0_g1_i1:63-845(+)
MVSIMATGQSLAPCQFLNVGQQRRVLIRRPPALSNRFLSQPIGFKFNAQNFVKSCPAAGRQKICCKARDEGGRPSADASLPVKLAWYGSEALGQITSMFMKPKFEATEGPEVWDPPKSREDALESLRKDYDQGYFVTGTMTLGIYKPDCEFSDPFVSFKGVDRFQKNVRNLGNFLEDVKLKIFDWQEVEGEDKISVRWRFSCTLALPWRPILAASGRNEHYFDKDWRIYRQVEIWDISPADGVKQLFKPNPAFRKKKRAD